jgi:hypothetical protein
MNDKHAGRRWRRVPKHCAYSSSRIGQMPVSRAWRCCKRWSRFSCSVTTSRRVAGVDDTYCTHNLPSSVHSLRVEKGEKGNTPKIFSAARKPYRKKKRQNASDQKREEKEEGETSCRKKRRNEPRRQNRIENVLGRCQRALSGRLLLAGGAGLGRSALGSLAGRDKDRILVSHQRVVRRNHGSTGPDGMVSQSMVPGCSVQSETGEALLNWSPESDIFAPPEPSRAQNETTVFK